MDQTSFLPKEAQNKRLPWIPWFFVLVFFGMAMVSRLHYEPQSGRFTMQYPSLNSGDDPHYLMVVNSLLFDGDLMLQEDYRRVRLGGLEAGKRFQGRVLDHHSFLVDTHTGEHSLWGRIFDPTVRVPCETSDCTGFYRKSPLFQDPSFVIERSSHPVAFPVILAAVLAPTFPSLAQVEGRVSWIIVIFSWITLLVTYSIARRAGLNPFVSIGGVLLLILASPWLAYSRSYFSEPLIGLILALGLWALQRNRMILAGLMVFLAMAVKPPFALVGLGWIVERLAARRIRSAFLLTGLLAAGGAILMAFNYWQIGIPLVGGNSSFQNMWKYPNPLPTLLDVQYGLFRFVPWVLLAWVGMLLSLRGETNEQKTLLRQIALPSFLFWILLSFYVHLGGSAYGPRFWVPFLPWFALGAGVVIARSSVKWVGIIGALALASALVAIPGTLLYPYSWDKPPHYAFQKLTSGIFR